MHEVARKLDHVRVRLALEVRRVQIRLVLVLEHLRAPGVANDARHGLRHGDPQQALDGLGKPRVKLGGAGCCRRRGGGRERADDGLRDRRQRVRVEAAKRVLRVGEARGRTVGSEG